jgi:hypothetical protein
LKIISLDGKDEEAKILIGFYRILEIFKRLAT